jgi:hypothetical protein
MAKDKSRTKPAEQVEEERTEARPDVRPTLPPYVPWKTFDNFLLGLKANMPGRIDRSVLGGMSGATQSQLISALRFFDLITEHGTPTDNLRGLVKSEGTDRSDKLGVLIDQAYRNVFPEDFDYQSGTYAQLSSVFSKTGAQGETLRKAIGFYLSAAKSADLLLSSYFTARGARPTRRRNAGGRGARGERVDAWETGDDDEDERQPATPIKTKFEVLMDKFPAFNPEWSAEVQAKWFDAFERIQKSEEGRA